MEKSNIMIRLEKKEEQRKVENLVRDSFWNVYAICADRRSVTRWPAVARRYKRSTVYLLFLVLITTV